MNCTVVPGMGGTGQSYRLNPHFHKRCCVIVCLCTINCFTRRPYFLTAVVAVTVSCTEMPLSDQPALAPEPHCAYTPHRNTEAKQFFLRCKISPLVIAADRCHHTHSASPHRWHRNPTPCHWKSPRRTPPQRIILSRLLSLMQMLRHPLGSTGTSVTSVSDTWRLL